VPPTAGLAGLEDPKNLRPAPNRRPVIPRRLDAY
jgi:hypothetical protein